MVDEANTLVGELRRLTTDTITQRSPTVKCQDLLASWELFENEIFPNYLSQRIKAADLESRARS